MSEGWLRDEKIPQQAITVSLCHRPCLQNIIGAVQEPHPTDSRSRMHGDMRTACCLRAFALCQGVCMHLAGHWRSLAWGVPRGSRRCRVVACGSGGAAMTLDVFEKFKEWLPPDCSIEVKPVLGTFQKPRIDFVIRHRNSWVEPWLVMLLKDGRNITKSDVMNMWDVIRSIKYGKGFIITMGDIEPDAAKAAHVYGIWLMDENCMNRLKDKSVPYGLPKYLTPITSHDKVRREAEMRAKKESGHWCARVYKQWIRAPIVKLLRLLRLRSDQDKSECELVVDLMVNYPIYEITREGTTRDEPNSGKTKMTVEKSKTSVDARLRRLVACDKDGISYRCGKNWVEVQILRNADKKITDKIWRDLKLDPETISNAQDDLVRDGRMEATDNSQGYKAKHSVREGLKSLTERYGAYLMHSDIPVMDATVSIEDAEDMVRPFGGHVPQIDPVFVPYHVFIFVVNGEKVMFVVSAVSKKFQPVPEIYDEVSRWLEREYNPGEKRT